jgi:hypothetical protein
MAEYYAECAKARNANYDAHDSQPDLPGIKLTRVFYGHSYKPRDADALDPNVLYLGHNAGQWFLGNVRFVDSGRPRWLIYSTGWGSFFQVEHLTQLYATDLPALADHLVEFPERPRSDEDGEE